MCSDGTWDYTWKNGRQLATMTDGTTTINYKYDSDGIRTEKKVGSTTWRYIYNGSRLVYLTNGTTNIFFRYDAEGNPMGLRYGGANYYYLRNAQNDIIGIVDTAGEAVVEYTYDAWGNILTTTGSKATTLGKYNPLRYRSYFYDTETGLYYLQSRYYNPEMGRFISADKYVYTGQGLLGGNMFVYCSNNPVNFVDPTGCFFKKVSEFVANTWSKIKTWAKNTFGAGSSTTATYTVYEKTIIPDYSPISAKQTVNTAQILTENGDSTKPISVYANKEITDPISSSNVGIDIHISDFNFNVSLGLSNIGCYGSIIKENTTKSLGLRADVVDFKVGFEHSVEERYNNTVNTRSTNIDVSGWFILACFGVTGYEYNGGGAPVPAQIVFQ